MLHQALDPYAAEVGRHAQGPDRREVAPTTAELLTLCPGSTVPASAVIP